MGKQTHALRKVCIAIAILGIAFAAAPAATAICTPGGSWSNDACVQVNPWPPDPYACVTNHPEDECI